MNKYKQDQYQQLFKLIDQEFNNSPTEDQMFQVIMESKKILDYWKKQGYE